MSMDERGNIITGDYGGAVISFMGENAKAEFGESNSISPKVKIFLENNARLYIGSNISIGGNTRIYVKDNAELIIGDNGRIGAEGRIRVRAGGKIVMGKDFTVKEQFNFCADPYTKIEIGDGCLFSYRVLIRSNDGHAIFDVNTGKNINSTESIAKERAIKIGNHVWVGMAACILYGTDIKEGSICGASSVVKGHFPNNCVLAGNPARVVRKDVAWSENYWAEDISECGEEYIGFTCEDV